MNLIKRLSHFINQHLFVIIRAVFISWCLLSVYLNSFEFFTYLLIPIFAILIGRLIMHILYMLLFDRYHEYFSQESPTNPADNTLLIGLLVVFCPLLGFVLLFTHLFNTKSK